MARTSSRISFTIHRSGWLVIAVFVAFGLFALMGGLVAFFFAIETRGQVLERLSPALDASAAE